MFLTVVGVVNDIKLDDVTEGERAVGAYFFPMAQDTPALVTFAVKTQTRGRDSLAALARPSLRSTPSCRSSTCARWTIWSSAALLNRRGPAQLALGFGGLALVLSAVGLYRAAASRGWAGRSRRWP